MATAPKAAKAPEAEEAIAPPKKSKKKLVMFLVILVLVLGGAGGAAMFLLGGDADPKSKTAKKVKKDPGAPPVFMVMDPFTVNLQPDGAGDQFLQVSFTLQVADPKEVELIKLYLPQVRSQLLLLLSGKKASQISTVDGKKKLAEEIMATVNAPFSPDAAPQNVTNVFFTSFVIQ
jgi:flagellar FliL protein